MTSTLDSSTTYPVDAEHGRLRLAVLLLFFGIWALSFIVLSQLIVSSGINLIAVIVGFGIAYGASNLIERQLKTRWPSGRAVVVDKNGVRLLRGAQVEISMGAEQAVTPVYWRFVIRKRSRMPKGWLMFACALQHEDQYLAVYTFMPPTSVDEYAQASLFTELTARKEAQGRTDLRLAGEQRRLRDAENQRWVNGAEMSADDFKHYVEQLQSQFPEWSPIQ